MYIQKGETNVLDDYLEVIKKSWTWEKLTEVEQNRFISCPAIYNMKGTYKQQWHMLNIIYSAFLHGVGYKPTGWREVN